MSIFPPTPTRPCPAPTSIFCFLAWNKNRKGRQSGCDSTKATFISFREGSEGVKPEELYTIDRIRHTHTHTHPYYRKSDDDTQSTKRYNIDTYKMAGCSSVFYLFTTGEWGGQPMCEKVYSRYTTIYIYILYSPLESRR
jgi:hypothetical protein